MNGTMFVESRYLFQKSTTHASCVNRLDWPAAGHVLEIRGQSLCSKKCHVRKAGPPSSWIRLGFLFYERIGQSVMSSGHNKSSTDA